MTLSLTLRKKTMKKWYRIELNVTSTEFSTCECYVEAESEREAHEEFELNPDAYEWDDWQVQDSEIRSWDVWSVEHDEGYTKHIAEKETKDEEV